MKKTKVKKIKKIPRYYDGSLAVLADFPMQLSTPGLKADAGAALKTMAGKAGLAISGAMPSIANVVGSVASPIAGALGIEQGLAGQIIGSIGSAVGMVNPIAGMALQIAGATAGGGAKLDKSAISTTSDIDDAVSHNTGWVGALFGADRDELLQKAAGIQNSKQSVELTAHAQEQWSNDPRNQRAVLNVKDGGLVPGEHYASRLEVETDNDGNNAVRYAWDPKGKDTYYVYKNPDGSSAYKNMVFNHEGVKRPDGTKYSDTAEMIITHTEDPKLKKINLKKLAAEQEVEKAKEGKTKNGIPAYVGGDDGNGGKWEEKVTLSRPFKLSKEVLDATTPSGPTKNDLVNTTIKKYGGNDKPIYRLLTLGQPVTLSQPDYKATSGSGMLDAYQWLSALVPLMDREKAEKVTLSRPTWKGIPVGVDVLKQLQDTQLGYDMSNYSITQGGYTAGQQLAARVAAADNLARQRAAIHAWQTQQQNENIAKNIASYNDHTRLLSEINDREADMNAANRGAARNINRQNRSQAFKNIGQILRDKKQYDMDLIRTEILKPMIESVYENSDVVIPMLNKQIKKKSTKKSKGE